MSTGYSWEGIRQICATLLGVRHVPERLCGGRVYLGRYIKCSTFTFYLCHLSNYALFHPHCQLITIKIIIKFSSTKLLLSAYCLQMLALTNHYDT